MYTPSQPSRSRCRAHARTFPGWLSLLAVGVATVLVAGCPRQRTAVQQDAYGIIPTADSAGGKLDRFLVPGVDADRDGVTDDRERAMRSSPDDPDTDKDGFPDGFEDRFADFGFDIAAADVDRDDDGLTDAREKAIGSDPGSIDTDGDGYSDFDEELNRHYGYDPVLETVDTDFDGLSDALETRIGSSPTDVDSNGDGISDFLAYDAGLPPDGEPLIHGMGELIGASYSQAMADALLDVRNGGALPVTLAEQLPYPDVTARITNGAIRPSAALMQRSLYNPHNSPGLYPTYAQLEQELFKLADHYDGSPGPRLVRLFYWTGQTQDNCSGGESRGGRRIYALKVSVSPDVNRPDPEIAFLGAHHARELITGTHTLALLRTLTDNYASDSKIRKLVETRETWVIPVVNPNGYDRAVSSQLQWRKNTRLEKGQDAITCGTDVNRNYGFAHLGSFTPAQRMTLQSAWANGVDGAGNLDPSSPQYPGAGPFSEVESQAVRGLAHSHFLTRNKTEVDGLMCALSWHSYGGVVGHPMSHAPIAPDPGLDPSHTGPFGQLTNDMATASGYADIKDGFRSLTSFPDGCAFQGYSVYGDVNDWMYKDKGTYSVLIESYSSPERGACGVGTTPAAFYPQDTATRDMVAKNNVQAALAMLRRCTL
jgi:hypothetical protein